MPEKSFREQKDPDCDLLEDDGVDWNLFAGVGMLGTCPSEQPGD